MSFKGFGAGACDWFAGLEADNSKAYFTANRAVFDTAIRGPMQALLNDMQDRFGGEAKLFRQHRDVRFSKDKSTYRTACYGGVYNEAHTMGWYVALDARGFYAGRGIYRMTPAQLTAYRDAVAAEGGAALAEAVAAAEAAGVEISGETLKTAPRGYPRDHPRAGLLARKAFVAGRRLPAAEVAELAPWDHALAVWADVAPVADWFDRALIG